MEPGMHLQNHPFGEAGCEAEVKLLGEDFKKYYFFNTRFNKEVLDPSVYLIIGRRGTGKTALSQFFLFQKTLKNAVGIDVKEPDLFRTVLKRLPAVANKNREVAVPQIVKVWELAIWSVVFWEFRQHSPTISAACIFSGQATSATEFVKHLFKSLLVRYTGAEQSLIDEFEELLADDRIKAGKKEVLQLARNQPIIIAFDTLENYSLDDENMMRAMAALIECASDFNQTYARQGVHLKLFIMDEVLPYLKQEIILNPLKSIRDEVHLHWRPKDLLRLICWRFYKFLKHHGHTVPSESAINWDDYNDVLRTMWNPYFGEMVVTRVGQTERTFPYILRHTQLRPRQLIVLCNNVARNAQRANRFPHFTREDIIEGVRKGEVALADEVINAYSGVYPNAGRIVEAMSGLPMRFEGKLLDKRAPQTSSAWPRGDYSPLIFRQMLAELGIVGRARGLQSKGVDEPCAQADFEYAIEQRLPLLVDTQCVVHPMFYERLNIATEPNYCVYPFPDHEAFKEVGF
jgi:hypothetical protein